MAWLEALNWNHIGAGGTGGAGAARAKAAKASSPHSDIPASPPAPGLWAPQLKRWHLSQVRRVLSRQYSAEQPLCVGLSVLGTGLGVHCHLWDSQEAEIRESSVL